MLDLAAIHRHSTDHRPQIEASTLCGCFFCMEVFPPDEITAWTGLDPTAVTDWETAEGSTALCPRCGSESVLGDGSGFAITPQLLNSMHQAWFQKTLLYKPARKA